MFNFNPKPGHPIWQFVRGLLKKGNNSPFKGQTRTKVYEQTHSHTAVVNYITKELEYANKDDKFRGHTSVPNQQIHIRMCIFLLQICHLHKLQKDIT